MNQDNLAYKIKFSLEEENLLPDIVSNYGNIAFLFRIGMFLRRIQIDENLINLYQCNYNGITNQVISIIESAIRMYEIFPIYTKKDVPVHNSDIYIKTLLICDNTNYNKLSEFYSIQSTIQEFLISNGIQINKREIIDIDSYPLFSSSKEKVDKYNEDLRINSSTNNNFYFTEIDMFYIMIKEKENNINDNISEMKITDQNKIDYTIIVTEIIFLLDRINVFLRKHGKIIILSSDDLLGGTVLKFELTTVF